MALPLKNPQVEALADEVATLTGETKTEAVRKSLLERRDRVRLLNGGMRQRNLGQFLETHIWPAIPVEVLGQTLSASERKHLEDDLGLKPR